MIKIIQGIRGLLRSVVYSQWVENIFYQGGFPAKINGQTIKIPLRFSKFYPAVYEVEKTEFIKDHCRPGSTAIDIGAHIGVFSFFLARSARRVYSFEPAPFTFSVLQKTIRLNKLEKIVEARRQVVSGDHKDVVFYIYKNSIISNANSLSLQNIKDKEATPISVQAIQLDDFLEENNFKDLSFIKIDVEGAELDILKGGIKLIGKYRPFMTLEVHPLNFADPVKTQREIFDLLQKMGYSIQLDKKNVNLEEFCSHTGCFEVFLIPS